MDDVEDDSELRRGLPVAHTIYGIPQTINTANYVYFLAFQEIFKLNLKGDLPVSSSSSSSAAAATPDKMNTSGNRTVDGEKTRKGKGKAVEVDLVALVTGRWTSDLLLHSVFNS